MMPLYDREHKKKTMETQLQDNCAQNMSPRFYLQSPHQIYSSTDLDHGAYHEVGSLYQGQYSQPSDILHIHLRHNALWKRMNTGWQRTKTNITIFFYGSGYSILSNLTTYLLSIFLYWSIYLSQIISQPK